jgi:oligopeptide transport system substrate-binding protein
MRHLLCAALAIIFATGCAQPSANAGYFGKVEPPEGQQLRYVSGGEPESGDPQIGTGQPEARIYLGLYEGLTEYDPQTGVAIPALAERWEITANNTEYTFHLRRNARFSDGAPITAADFVYTVRRGLSPELASRNGYMGYDILYGQAFNEAASFVRDPATGSFVMDPATPERRLVVPSDEGERTTLTPQAAAAIRGKQLVPVRGEDLGVEAVDDFTVRIRTERPVPFLPGLMAHQLFRIVPRQAIERHGSRWTRPENIVTSGAFLLQTWNPYDRIVIVRNPMYWDAATVRLDRITFYAMDDQTTMMNLYKAGEVDATYNHTVPAAWLDQMRGFKDYMNKPEAATEYYSFNVTRAPMDDVRVRKAFNMAIDKDALGRFRGAVHPNTSFVPIGVFPGYPNAKGDTFDAEQAKRLLADAGYRDAAGNYDPSRFPVREVELTYNTSENNRQVAEFAQAQFKQNLGLTVPIKNMEFRTFIPFRNNREYRGLARGGWIGDYLDPFTFLDLFSIREGNNASGWWDPAYVKLLRDGNREPDPMKRFTLLAKAEQMLLDAQAVLPLYTNDTNWIKKPYVQGMYANPLTMHAWKYVWIEHDSSKWN